MTRNTFEAKGEPDYRDALFLDDRQTATVLAALRFWQSTPHVPPRFHTISTNGDQCVPLDNEEIDTLCEEINQ